MWYGGGLVQVRGWVVDTWPHGVTDQPSGIPLLGFLVW